MTETKTEPETPTQTESEPEGGPFVITTKTKDYMGQTLLNIATNATDYLGRATIVTDRDYMGRLLLT